MKNKKGSHVGMILSFVIFVTFLFFVLSVLNPAMNEQKNKQLNLDLLKSDLFNKLNSNISVTSLKIKNNTAELSCFQINDFLNLNGLEVRVKDEGNNLVGFSVPGGNIEINSGERFFKIYHSNNFENGSTRSCDTLDQENYTFGATRTEEYLFEKNVLGILEEYSANYTQLKKSFGVLDENEFGISFTNSSGYEFQKGFQDVTGNVYIEEIPIQYYDSDANIQSGSIKIRVW